MSPFPNSLTGNGLEKSVFNPGEVEKWPSMEVGRSPKRSGATK
jgi:hypothetical protein